MNVGALSISESSLDANEFISESAVLAINASEVSQDVLNVLVEYIADGFLYSYPGYVNLGLDEYKHTTTAYKMNPTAGVTYTGTNYFASDRVLSTSAGSPFVGHFLTFYNTINGSLDTYTLKIS